MSREPGYYWVKVRADRQPTVLYTDGVAWRCGARILRDQDLHEIREERLPTPEEMDVALMVPREAWSQALIAETAMASGAEDVAVAALAKMRRLLDVTS